VDRGLSKNMRDEAHRMVLPGYEGGKDSAEFLFTDFTLVKSPDDRLLAAGDGDVVSLYNPQRQLAATVRPGEKGLRSMWFSSHPLPFMPPASPEVTVQLVVSLPRLPGLHIP